MNELLAEFLRSLTATNDWAAIMPEIMLALLALGLLGAEMVLPRANRGGSRAWLFGDKSSCWPSPWLLELLYARGTDLSSVA